ncbi:probable methyltransferase At1g29790 [Phragmites australis]|uniref:probable methyltransferase At1g29790 n=1 Tax=Phragmites australis TaxID=29695 RepID=UPI002D79D50C|nr:probable methyltransferase At1g29790 [Phragmites australis]
MECDLLHGNGKMKPATSRRRYCSTTAVTLLLFLLTNTVSILVSSGAGPSLLRRYKPATIRLWDDSAALIADLNATQSALAASRAELAGLYARIGTANELLRTLLAAMPPRDGTAGQRQVPGDVDGWAREPSGELKLASGPHRPMVAGYGRNATGEVVFPALGHACNRFQDDLERYMDYTPSGECPSDEALEHWLMLSGCEPLPRRRCRPRSPTGYVQPMTLPKSLWAMPPDTTVVWDAFPCKNYSCLVKNRGTTAHGCDGCFDLRRREKGRWTRDVKGSLDYSIDAVLAARPNGTVRIGLDIGGGGSSGTFAARMLERGVTVVTASMNSGAPFNSFIASRGLVPMHISIGHRLPFFDRTLDIVHATHELGSSSMPDVMLEFALFDIYRVLRPGGLFWLDHFLCTGTQLNATYAPMLDRIGFKKARWNTGRRLGRGKEKNEWYISALLEKPMT